MRAIAELVGICAGATVIAGYISAQINRRRKIKKEVRRHNQAMAKLGAQEKGEQKT